MVKILNFRLMGNCNKESTQRNYFSNLGKKPFMGLWLTSERILAIKIKQGWQSRKGGGEVGGELNFPQFRAINKKIK